MKKLLFALFVLILMPGLALAEKTLFGVAIRSLTNPYNVQIIEGAKLYCNSLPKESCEVQTLISEGSDEKQINDIKAFIARGGKVLYVDPNNAPNAAVIAEICEDAEVYWSTAWSYADGTFPWDYKYYVFHQSPDDQKSGYDIAKTMFDNFATPGKGKILAMQGMLANDAAINRFKGLQRALAEYPEVTLLDDQAGNWNPQEAYKIAETWLVNNKEIDGIWVANDSMALAVVEALKAKGLNQKVLVAGVDSIDGAVKAVKSGDMIATVSTNPYMQSGYGLAVPYQAYQQKADTTQMPKAETMIYTSGLLITKDSVANYEKNYIQNKPVFDYTDFKSIIVKPYDIATK